MLKISVNNILTIFVVAILACFYSLNVDKEKEEHLVNYRVDNVIRYLSKVVAIYSNETSDNIDFDRLLLDMYANIYLIDPDLASKSSIILKVKDSIIDLKPNKEYKLCVFNGVSKCSNIVYIGEVGDYVPVYIVIDCQSLTNSTYTSSIDKGVVSLKLSFSTFLSAFNSVVCIYLVLFVLLISFVVSILIDFYRMLNKTYTYKIIGNNLTLYTWEKYFPNASQGFKQGFQNIFIERNTNNFSREPFYNDLLVEVDFILVEMFRVAGANIKIFFHISEESDRLRGNFELNSSLWLDKFVRTRMDVSLQTCLMRGGNRSKFIIKSNFDGIKLSKILLIESEYNV